MSVFNRDSRDDYARGARAVVVCPDFKSHGRSIDARLDEAEGLALAIGIEVFGRASFPIRQAKPATLFGSGQAESIAALVQAHEAELVIVDGALTPVQQRNLESSFKAKVIDRTGLILEIFGERAASAEGRLQVELAHLDYQAGRLVRSWTHLERQRGGFGFLGGPGETQIEADRRLIRDRMAKIRRELSEVSRTRGLHRSNRQKAPWPIMALVGYTNAGKSTLFNLLTQSDVMAEDLLFATLDPAMRAIALPGVDKAILSDTVGFVSDLPTQLVAAFRATLEEVTTADVIIHVRDIAHSDSEAQAKDVQDVLGELGIAQDGTTPIIEVWNKVDLLDGEAADTLRAQAERRDDVVVVSAITGVGTDALRAKMAELVTAQHSLYTLELPASAGAALAWLHAHGEVQSQKSVDDQIEINVRLSEPDHARFVRRYG